MKLMLWLNKEEDVKEQKFLASFIGQLLKILISDIINLIILLNINYEQHFTNLGAQIFFHY